MYRMSLYVLRLYIWTYLRWKYRTFFTWTYLLDVDCR